MNASILNGKDRRKLDPLHEQCPLKAAVDVIGGRWKPSILYDLLGGPKRFSELQRSLTGVKAQTLTVQLRELENDGVVRRNVFPEVPPRVEYELTAHGRTLAPLLGSLRAWGEAHLRQAARNNGGTDAQRVRPQKS